ncbi:MAG: methyltransferase domain-containing protein [bacterium]|nr:methyltransferase domain-containing protein [bacterium]
MQLEKQNIYFKSLFIIIKELLKGKSLPRIFLNINLKNSKVSGHVLDLGSKSSSASYNRFLQKEDNCKMTFTDWHESGEDIIKLNLEEPFNIEDNNYDFITSFNVMEHIFDYNNLVKESYRILKSGGVYIGQTPFLVNYHADPNDYFRYTHQAIEKIFEEAGFICQKMIYLGFGPLSASLSLKLHIIPKILRPFFTLCAIGFDFIILKLRKSQRLRYPLGYLFVFKK